MAVLVMRLVVILMATLVAAMVAVVVAVVSLKFRAIEGGEGGCGRRGASMRYLMYTTSGGTGRARVMREREWMTSMQGLAEKGGKVEKYVREKLEEIGKW